MWLCSAQLYCIFIIRDTKLTIYYSKILVPEFIIYLSIEQTNCISRHLIMKHMNVHIMVEHVKTENEQEKEEEKERKEKERIAK